MAVDSFFCHGDKVFYRGAIKNALHLSSDAERIPSGTRYRLPGHFPSRAILIFHIFLRSHIPAGHNPRTVSYTHLAVGMQLDINSPGMRLFHRFHQVEFRPLQFWHPSIQTGNARQCPGLAVQRIAAQVAIVFVLDQHIGCARHKTGVPR